MPERVAKQPIPATMARRPRGEPRRLLLDAARALFAGQDYRSTTTREIAQAAGVTEHLLFRNFGSKAALFREALVVPFVSFVDEFGATWRSVVPEETDEEELTRLFVSQLYDVFVEHQGLLLTLMAAENLSDEEKADAGIAEIRRAVTVLGQISVEGMQLRGLRSDHPDLPAHSTVSMIAGMAALRSTYFGNEPPPREVIVEELVQALLHGFLHRNDSVRDSTMTSPSAIELYYDPFDVEIDSDPYPVWKRMREEAPLYYNEKYNFYALSRYDDVVRELPNWETYRSGRGTTADILFANIEVPPGILLFEDPPLHDLHRKLLSRVFTPRRMLAVEHLVRGFCVGELDPLVGGSGFDFIADLGAMMPMRTIGYLLGIPEADQEKIRDRSVANIELSRDADPAAVDANVFANSIALFAEYIEWRADHPSDDLMTELLRAEIDEPDGTRRPLSRTEVLAYTAMIAGAGNETTARLIGFMGQLLSDHPDQRRELVEDPSLIPGAIEETLRYEPPSPVQARYVARDAEHYGRKVPEGSFMLLLNASANRDESHFPDADRYDIHRRGSHLSFGQGLHFCLGSALARLEARVAFEEVLKRWPDWEVDYANAQRAHTASVRGWARLPVVVG